MLQLQPDTSAEPLVLPDKNSEIVREADTVVGLNEPLQIPEKAITVMRVRTGNFTVNVSINTLRPADRLVVTFQGARGGGKETTNSRRPMFGRRNFDALYNIPCTLRAFRLVQDRHPDASLTLVGGGPEESRLKALAPLRT